MVFRQSLCCSWLTSCTGDQTRKPEAFRRVRLLRVLLTIPEDLGNSKIIVFRNLDYSLFSPLVQSIFFALLSELQRPNLKAFGTVDCINEAVPRVLELKT